MELGAIAILYRDVDTAINFTLRAIAQCYNITSLLITALESAPWLTAIGRKFALSAQLPHQLLAVGRCHLQLFAGELYPKYSPS